MPRCRQLSSRFHLSLLRCPQCLAQPSRRKLKQVGRKVKGAANLELKQISITLPLKTHTLTSIQSLVAPGRVPSPQSLGTPVTLSRHGRQQAHKPEPGKERKQCRISLKHRGKVQTRAGPGWLQLTRPSHDSHVYKSSLAGF